MITRPRHLAALALLSLFGVLPGPRSANAYEPNRVRITGRVVDRSGLPLRDTWVVTQGSRRTGTLVGASGRYTLDVPGSTQLELSRTPLLLRVQARRKGWKLSMPGGVPELAVELRIVSDSLGGTRFQVRSNDPAVASMLANDAVLQSGTQVTLRLDFVGTRGIQVENDVADMNAMQEVMLSPPTRAAPPVLLANAGRIEDLAVETAHDSPASDTTPAPSHERPLDPVSALLAQAKTARAADNTPATGQIRADIAGQLVSPAIDARAPRGPAKKANPGSKPEPPRSAGDVPPDSDVDPPVAVAPLLPPDSEAIETRTVMADAAATRVADSATHVEDSEQPPAAPAREPVKRAPKTRATRAVRPAAVEDEALPTAEDVRREDEKPRVIRPGDPEAQAAEVEKRMMKRKPRARAASAEEIRTALQLLGEPVTSPLSAKPATLAAVEKNVPRAEVPAIAPSGADASPAAADKNATSVSPPSASAPSPSPVTTDAATSDGSSDPAATADAPKEAAAAKPTTPPTTESTRGSSGCDCRIEGTIEVNSENPLPERTQAMVWLADEPRTYTTVELFMGSPRQFELRGVSCRSHALKVTVRSKQRFMMTAPTVVDCSGGGYRQAKIVLEPLQKKR